jgi:hypothetical protein
LTVLSPTLPIDETSDAPILLSNLRLVSGDAIGSPAVARIQQIVSYAYLNALLSDPATDRCSGKPVPAFESYLLKSVLSDPVSLVKILSLWSNLEIFGRKTDAASQNGVNQRESLIVNMINGKLDTLQLAATTEENRSDRVKVDYAKVARKISPSIPRDSPRYDFSNQDGTKFERAADDVMGMVSGKTTAANLTAAKATLVNLLLKRLEPGCTLPNGGLFRAKGYDPFLYIGVIDSLTAVRSTR